LQLILELYGVLLHPHLECAAPIWDPNLIKGTTKLDNVQKFALKMCLKQSDLGYQDLDLSQFPPLENHKLCLNLCTLYKIMQGYLYFPVFLLLVSRHSYSLPSVHMLRGCTNAFQSSFIYLALILYGITYLMEHLQLSPLIHLYRLHYCKSFYRERGEKSSRDSGNIELARLKKKKEERVLISVRYFHDGFP